MNSTPFSIFHILKQKSQLALQNHHGEYAQRDFFHSEKDFALNEQKKEGSSDVRELNNNKHSSLTNMKRHAEMVHDEEDRNNVLNSSDSVSEQALEKSKEFIQRLKTVRNSLHESQLVADKNVKECSCSNSSDIDHSPVESQNNADEKDTDKRTFSVTSNEADTQMKIFDKNLQRNMHSKLNRDIDEHSSEENETFRKYPDSSNAVFRQHTFQHHFDFTRFGNCDRLNDLKLHPYKFDVKSNLKLPEYDPEHQDLGKFNTFIVSKLLHVDIYKPFAISQNFAFFNNVYSLKSGAALNTSRCQ